MLNSPTEDTYAQPQPQPQPQPTATATTATTTATSTSTPTMRRRGTEKSPLLVNDTGSMAVAAPSSPRSSASAAIMASASDSTSELPPVSMCVRLMPTVESSSAAEVAANSSSASASAAVTSSSADGRVSPSSVPLLKRYTVEPVPDPLRNRVRRFFTGKHLYTPRVVDVPVDYEAPDAPKYPPNVVRNQKYSVFTFLPLTLYDQFKYFYNMYFLGIALTQFVPVLKVGFLFTYLSPLAFVLALSIGKEFLDDFQRFLQDRRANSQLFQRVLPTGEVVEIASADIRVGHLIQLSTNNRVPADMVLLKTTDKSGASFIRTDQLDGETDWKLRRPLSHTQPLSREELAGFAASMYIEAPRGDIYSFAGKYMPASGEDEEPISCENTMWANTVVATGQVIGAVIYTGRETRSAMNRSSPRSKRGKTEDEVNFLSKILFAILAVLSFFMVCLQGFRGMWYVYFVRFMILFAAIIPISMRVNLDMAKLLYTYFVNRDKKIPGTIVRNSNLPEELGRINYLLTDKTGTLTQNDMSFKKFHLGTSSFRSEDTDSLRELIASALASGAAASASEAKRAVKQRKGTAGKALLCVRALALCHNVTPAADADTGEVHYQASSPDEVALVKFTESIGVTLHQRDLHSITLKTASGDLERYEVLKVFPFSSATKRMGIIIREPSGALSFFMKGADTVMLRIVAREESEWMAEETGNMAREGLRTLVFGIKSLSEEELADFERRYHDAECTMENRDANIQHVVETLEQDLQPLCVTGVEDKLQEDVRPTLELLQHAGIRVWMLTGDKIETATCIAISARLFKPTHIIKTIAARDVTECKSLLEDFADTPEAVLVIDGNSLQMCLENFRQEFFQAAQKAPSVVCCRCSPTQKASIVELLKFYTQCRTCAIGDGGNDVSMILAADVGLGIEGKEGKQASLAADFSLTQFSHIGRLIMWHGRNSYKRSALLAQFIMHRGMIISVIQAIFSALFFLAAVAIYQGWILVGYATFYTMFPVFSLVLDQDVSDTVAMQFPELYQELQKGRILSLRTFTTWMFTSVYQGGMIMLSMLFLFEDNFTNIASITFTVLILTELLNIAFEIYTWNWVMLASELATLALYFGSMALLPSYFSMSFILTTSFWWRVAISTVVSCLPVSLTRWAYRRCFPATWRIVNEARHSDSRKGSRRSLFGKNPWD